MGQNNAIISINTKVQKPILPGLIDTSDNVPNLSRNLTYYLEQSFKNSPILKENSNLYASAELDSAKIKASQKPNLSANSTAQFFPTLNGYGYNQAITNGGNYIATLNLSQPLFNRFSRKTYFKNNQIKKDSLINSNLINKKEVKKEIVNSYIIAYSSQKGLEFQKEILELYKKQQGIFKQLVQKGIYKQSDYLTFLVSLGSEEIALTQAEIIFHNNLSQLNLQCGIADTGEVKLQDPQIRPYEFTPFSNTPQFKKFLIDSLSLLGQRDLVNLAYKPKINWIADAGYESPNFNLFYKSFGASIELNFSLPIYDGHIRRINLKQIDLLENTRRAFMERFKMDYFSQIISLKKQINDNKRLEIKTENQFDNTKLLVEVNRRLLEIGDVKINDLILSINNFKNLRFTINQIQINQLVLQNQINYWSGNY